MQPEKKQNKFSIGFGKILLTQEIIHTRNEIFESCSWKLPQQEKATSFLGFKKYCEKIPSLCLPSSPHAESHQKFFCTDRVSDPLEDYGSV